jgi:hypothetical protein
MLKSLSDDGHARALLGVYLLGGMSARDEAAVRAHLDECQGCRDEYEYLAVVPQWLDLVKETATDRRGRSLPGQITGCPRGDAGPDDIDPGPAVELAQDM